MTETPGSPSFDKPGPPPSGGPVPPPYNPPPTGPGYDPAGAQPGYGQPAGNVYGQPGQPSGFANSDEKTFALLAHFGGILLSALAPLIVFLVKGNESPTVRAHAVEALNFQLTWLAIGIVVTAVTCGFGGVIFLFPLVMAIIAGLKANNGEFYRYPATFRLIK